MKKEINSIKKVIVDSVETEFHVDVTSDDGGSHFCIYLPKGTSVEKLREGLRALTLPMHYVILSVPDGYIECFLR